MVSRKVLNSALSLACTLGGAVCGTVEQCAKAATPVRAHVRARVLDTVPQNRTSIWYPRNCTSMWYHRTAPLHCTEALHPGTKPPAPHLALQHFNSSCAQVLSFADSCLLKTHEVVADIIAAVAAELNKHYETEQQ